MSERVDPPKSPTLLPPRKSVELEDPGAHELDSSSNGEDVFSDAQEGETANSRSNSPIPTTRVEKVLYTYANGYVATANRLKVDDRENYGEVPGTPAYKMREQDAVPDEIDVIPEGQTRTVAKSQVDRSGTLGGSPIPKTVVEKVDPTFPSHGDVPGTLAHSKRRADAVPDIIRPTLNEDNEVPKNLKDDLSGASSPHVAIPMTVITRTDSQPSHGEVPGTEAYNIRKSDAKPDIEEKGDVHSESQYSGLRESKQHVDRFSPIAADGGFGPMVADESEDGTADSEHVLDQDEDSSVADDDEGFGDDFDDFEAGAENEDFRGFDETTSQSFTVVGEATKARQEAPTIQSLPPPDIPFPLLDFRNLNTLDDILTATNPYLDEMFPSTKEVYPEPPPPASTSNSIFLTDRSLSLWSQLVAPPPLQPPNWVRSRIRRLFLVSLGVPVDLDEILPASKQKKLILPSTHLRNDSPSPSPGHRTGSRVRLKQDNASSTSVDKAGTSTKGKRRKGPSPAPALDLQATKMFCATTVAALSNMTDGELDAHRKKLGELTSKANEVLEYWLKRRDSALGDKEAFEGVIENLVKHARKVRR